MSQIELLSSCTIHQFLSNVLCVSSSMAPGYANPQNYPLPIHPSSIHLFTHPSFPSFLRPFLLSFISILLVIRTPRVLFTRCSPKVTSLHASIGIPVAQATDISLSDSNVLYLLSCFSINPPYSRDCGIFAPLL